jgi:DNA-binding response OmpR family regulator
MKLLILNDDCSLGPVWLQGLRARGQSAVWVRDLPRAAAHASDAGHQALLIGPQRGDALEAVTLALRPLAAERPLMVWAPLADPARRIALLQAGADDAADLSQPLDEVLARLGACARRRRPAATTRLRVDPLARVARLGAKEVRLTPRETGLLEALELAAGRVVPRAVLVQQVWGHGEDPSAGALEYHVHQLRRKLGAQVIRTVAGIGYSLSTPT